MLMFKWTDKQYKMLIKLAGKRMRKMLKGKRLTWVQIASEINAKFNVNHSADAVRCKYIRG